MEKKKLVEHSKTRLFCVQDPDFETVEGVPML